MTLTVGLKEWAAVWDLILSGRYALLLRKGGIHEPGGPGVFEIEHERFALFPSWLHQNEQMLKPEAAKWLEADPSQTVTQPADPSVAQPGDQAAPGRMGNASCEQVAPRDADDRQQMDAQLRIKPQPGHVEPERVAMPGHGWVHHIWQVPSRRALDRVANLLPFTSAYLDQRWDYKPQRPLYLLALHVVHADQPKVIEQAQRYAGCRSWVPLEPGDQWHVDDAASPVMTPKQMASIVEQVSQAMR